MRNLEIVRVDREREKIHLFYEGNRTNIIWEIYLNFLLRLSPATTITFKWNSHISCKQKVVVFNVFKTGHETETDRPSGHGSIGSAMVEPDE